MNQNENPLGQKEGSHLPQSPESQEKIKREQSAKARLYAAFVDHEIEKGNLFTVDEFLQTSEFAEAKKSFVDYFKTEEGFDVGISHIHQRFDKSRDSLKGAKDSTVPPTVVNQDLKDSPVKQENEIPLITLDTDSLRLETDKEAEARIKALDAKYSVTKSTDQSAANDPIFETNQQEDTIKVVEPVDTLDTPPVPSAAEKIIPASESQNQIPEVMGSTESPQEEIVTDPNLGENEVGVPDLGTALNSTEQAQAVSEPVQEIEAENSPVTAEVFSPNGDRAEQKVNTPESVESPTEVFDPEVKKAFENVVESSIKLLNKLDERDRDGLNDLISGPSVRRFARAIADIRDSQKLDDGLLNSLNQATDALAEFGVPQEDRLSEDIESLKRLRDTVSDLGQDVGAFGKKIRDTYGDKAEPHIKLLVNLLDSLDLGAQRLTSREYRVRDYLDR